MNNSECIFDGNFRRRTTHATVLAMETANNFASLIHQMHHLQTSVVTLVFPDANASVPLEPFNKGESVTFLQSSWFSQQGLKSRANTSTGLTSSLN